MSEDIIGLDSYILGSFSCLGPVCVCFGRCVASSLGFGVTECFLALFAGSFGVAEGDWLFGAAVWPTLFLLNVSTAIKGTHNYFFICQLSFE